MTVLTLALPKGRLAEQGIALLERSGVDCAAFYDPGRKLVMEDGTGSTRFSFSHCG